MPDENEVTSPGTPVPSLVPRADSTISLSKLQQIVGIAVTLGTLFAGMVLTYTQVGRNTDKIDKVEAKVEARFEKVDGRQAAQGRLLTFVCTEVTKNVRECQLAEAPK